MDVWLTHRHLWDYGMTTLSCPSCGRLRKLRDEELAVIAGRQGRCTECGWRGILPQPCNEENTAA